MGMSKNLMLAYFPDDDGEEDDFDDFFASTQADDWSRITGLGLPLPGPEEIRKEAVPF
jgi:hypothetical protein